MPHNAPKTWPWWKKAVAYLTLAALAAVAIGVVDRKVHNPPDTPSSAAKVP